MNKDQIVQSQVSGKTMFEAKPADQVLHTRYHKCWNCGMLGVTINTDCSNCGLYNPENS